MQEICTLGSAWGDEFKKPRSLGEGTGAKASDNSEAPQRATASRLVSTIHRNPDAQSREKPVQPFDAVGLSATVAELRDFGLRQPHDFAGLDLGNLPFFDHLGDFGNELSLEQLLFRIRQSEISEHVAGAETAGADRKWPNHGRNDANDPFPDMRCVTDITATLESKPERRRDFCNSIGGKAENICS